LLVHIEELRLIDRINVDIKLQFSNWPNNRLNRSCHKGSKPNLCRNLN
jgi:hypothetical protein